MKTTFSLLFVFLFAATFAQEKLVVMQPTGEMKNDLPVMILLSDTTQLYRNVDEIVSTSFMKETIELYYLAANYLKNNNEILKTTTVNRVASCVFAPAE